MTETLLSAALARRNTRRPPVWFMRQAGRYHRHYQRLRARHEFIDLCKQPELAAQVTMGPIDDFGFDAAILFSDLLFPLEAMGFGLRYEPGPKLGWYLRSAAQLPRLRGGREAAADMEFQAEAIRLLRGCLGSERALIGFVGGPFTLYAYAVAGAHEGFTRQSLPGLEDGLYTGFCERLTGLLAGNMVLQAQAGADCVAIFDTAAGALDAAHFARHAVGPLAQVVAQFRAACPDTPLIYYSRDTGPDHWRALEPLDDLERADAALVLAGQSESGLAAAAGRRARGESPGRIHHGRCASGGGARGLGVRPGARGPAADARGKYPAGAQDRAGNVRMNTEQLRARLAKYDVPGPRYTSYPTVPYWEDTPSEAQWLERLGAALGGGRQAGHGASLYVHVPFCRALCTFCGCNTRVTRTHAIVGPYVQAVLAEYALYRERLSVPR